MVRDNSALSLAIITLPCRSAAELLISFLPYLSTHGQPLHVLPSPTTHSILQPPHPSAV